MDDGSEEDIGVVGSHGQRAGVAESGPLADGHRCHDTTHRRRARWWRAGGGAHVLPKSAHVLENKDKC